MPKVLLTRPRQRTHKNDTLHRTLMQSGVQVLELPMLNFELPRDTGSLDQAIERAATGEYAYVILASPTAVHFLHDRAEEIGFLEALQHSGSFGAVGHATAEEAIRCGFRVELPIPASAGSHQLAAMLGGYKLIGSPILLLQSQLGLDVLDNALSEMGAQADRETLYYTKGPTLGDSARLLHLLESGSTPDVIAFFSPSSVMYFIRTLAEMASGLIRMLPPIACIGETTAKAVEEALHRRPEIVARKADQASLAEDILAYLRLNNPRQE
jgi:uroporphyrinogen-III synthase